METEQEKAERIAKEEAARIAVEETKQAAPLNSENPSSQGIEEAVNRVSALYDGIVNSERRQREELAAEVERLKEERNTTAANAAAQKSPEENAAAFFADPDKRIAEAVAKQVAPLNQLAQEMRHQSAYANLKGNVLNNPMYKAAFEQFGGQIDQAMANIAPTQQNLELVISAIVGRATLTGSYKPANSTPSTPANTPNRPNVPGSLPSSVPAPAAPPVNNAPVIPLNEFEKRVARENNMTEDEYRTFRDSPATYLHEMAKKKREDAAKK